MRYLAHFLNLVAADTVDGALDRYLASRCYVDLCDVLALNTSPLDGASVCNVCLESDMDHMRVE